MAPRLPVLELVYLMTRLTAQGGRTGAPLASACSGVTTGRVPSGSVLPHTQEPQPGAGVAVKHFLRECCFWSDCGRECMSFLKIIVYMEC